MTQSHFHDDVTEIVPNRASAYEKKDGGGFKVEDSNVSAVGAICLYTSVEDLAKWVRNFQAREVAGDVLDDAFHRRSAQRRHDAGLRLWADDRPLSGLKTISHGGVDSGYRAELLWFPKADFGVVILANLSQFKPGWMARKVADLCLGERLSESELLDSPTIDLPQDDLAALAGLYRDERRGVTRRVEMRDGKLGVTIFEESQELVPFGNGRFRPRHAALGSSDSAERRRHARIPRDHAQRSEPHIHPRGGDKPTPEALASYAGSYYLSRTRCALHPARARRYADPASAKAEDRELKPTVTDAFSAGSADVVFTRDGRGDVSGFEIFTERIRYLRFDRM